MSFSLNGKIMFWSYVFCFVVAYGFSIFFVDMTYWGLSLWFAFTAGVLFGYYIDDQSTVTVPEEIIDSDDEYVDVAEVLS